MEIIPVIDLMQSQVVHARMGHRQHYQPIVSTLCKSSQPLEVVQALLELYPFRTLYMADIDAIQGANEHQILIRQIARKYPTVHFWLDCGIKHPHDLWETEPNMHYVIGSENMADLECYLDISHALAGKHLLSLDIAGDQRLGPAALHDAATYWPAQVIGMQLRQVGSGLGTNTALLGRLARLNQAAGLNKSLYAAGGVRHIEDCHQLRTQGISGALIATALHDGSIGSKALTAFYRQ